MNILGIRIDNFSKPEVLNKVSAFFSDGQQHKIFTPNPEMLVDAQKDEYFKQVLNSGDLNICDGVGLWLVMSLRGAKRRSNPIEAGDCFASPPTGGSARNDTRYPGTDLMQDICQLAAEQGRSVYLLGSGNDAVINRTVEELKKSYPKLRIVGSNKGIEIKKLSPPRRDPVLMAGRNLEINYEKDENDESLHDIIMKAPDILFVAFGHVKQEKWIYENLKHLPSVKIAMGVGGAFDYISGKTKRAPLFLRKIGLEWMYRLFKEPWRIGRIVKATAIFLYHIIFK